MAKNSLSQGLSEALEERGPIAEAGAPGRAFEIPAARWWTRALRMRLARLGLLAGVDLLALCGAWLFAYMVWANALLHQPLAIYSQILPLLVTFPLAYAASGLYPGFGLGAVETLRRLSFSTTFCFLAMAACSFA